MLYLSWFNFVNTFRSCTKFNKYLQSFTIRSTYQLSNLWYSLIVFWLNSSVTPSRTEIWCSSGIRNDHLCYHGIYKSSLNMYHNYFIMNILIKNLCWKYLESNSILQQVFRGPGRIRTGIQRFCRSRSIHSNHRPIIYFHIKISNILSHIYL